MTTQLTNAMVGISQSVVDEMLLLDSAIIPIISRIGMGDINQRALNTKHEWNEDTLYPTKSTLTSGINNSSDTTVPVASATPFRIGHVVRVDEEFMLITNITSLNLTVTRAYGGTNIASHSNAAEIEVMHNLSEEGAAARAARSKARVNKYNYTQIFDDTISISDTALAVRNMGLDDLYLYERIKKQKELAAQLERSIVKGVRYQSGDVRYMGGLRNFITTNLEDANAGEISLDLINAVLSKIYLAGGMEGGDKALLMSGTQKRFLGNIAKADLKMEQQNRVIGTVADFVDTDYGRLPVMLHPAVPADEIIVADFARMKIVPLREFSHIFLGRTGDKTEGQVVGEYTVEIMQEQAMGRITSLATSPVEE